MRSRPPRRRSKTPNGPQTGRDDAADAVDAFVEEASESVAVDAFPEHDDLDELIAALDAVAEAVADADLDPDADAETIAALIDATDGLEAGLDDAEEWDDLETHEQLRAQGYYDVLGHYKDFPVEWSALKEHEARGNVDMILLALNSLESDFMERHCLEAFERMGKRGKTEASLEELLGRAEKRDQFAIRILGKMAAEEATETLVEFVSEDSNPQLQKIVFKALGEIGAAEAVQPLADQLDPEGTPRTSCAPTPPVRSDSLATPARSTPSPTRSPRTIPTTSAPPPAGRSARSARAKRSKRSPSTRTSTPSSSPPRPRRPSSPSTRRRRPPDADRGSTDHSYLMPRARSPCRPHPPVPQATRPRASPPSRSGCSS